MKILFLTLIFSLILIFSANAQLRQPTCEECQNGCPIEFRLEGTNYTIFCYSKCTFENGQKKGLIYEDTCMYEELFMKWYKNFKSPSEDTECISPNPSI